MSALGTSLQAIADKQELTGISIAMSRHGDRVFWTAYVHWAGGRCASGDDKNSPDRALEAAISNANAQRLILHGLPELEAAE